MDIGFLSLKDGSFSGRVRTLAHRLNVEFEPIAAADKRGGESPDFQVYARDGGDLVPLGSAWKKTTSRGAAVVNFLSITLDDPSFPAPLNVAAFPDEAGDTWRIVWTRPRQARDAG